MGHDPRRIVPLCDAHHDARHEGDIAIRFGEDDEPHFYRRDGVELVRTRVRMDESVEIAVAGLASLEVPKREARARVLGILAMEPDRDWSPEELVLAALRARPG